GCGACVAACPNASAMLFTSAKVSHLALLPQGQPERSRRVRAMVAQMQAEMFGACTNLGECEAVCPKGIKLENIARMNREFLKAAWAFRKEAAMAGGGWEEVGFSILDWQQAAKIKGSAEFVVFELVARHRDKPQTL